MPEETLYARGLENARDMFFIRDEVIPRALDQERWNLIVFEAYRVVELCIKGMTCLSGHEPEKIHEIDCLVGDFVDKLEEMRTPIPFFCALTDPHGNYYGVWICGDEACLFKHISGSWTQLASAIDLGEAGIDLLSELELHFENSVLSLIYMDEVILWNTDSNLHGSLKKEMRFRKPSDATLLDRMKKVGRALRADRERAFYHEASYTRDDAQHAIRLMHQALEAAESFLVID